jgi:hypothetical protein
VAKQQDHVALSAGDHGSATAEALALAPSYRRGRHRLPEQLWSRALAVQAVE